MARRILVPGLLNVRLKPHYYIYLYIIVCQNVYYIRIILLCWLHVCEILGPVDFKCHHKNVMLTDTWSLPIR